MYLAHSSKGGFKRCYHSHPPLPIVVDGKEYKIYGGSCSDPVVKDADIYVGFDYSMNKTDRQYPWTEGSEFLYHITDMSVPKSVKSFKQLIAYLADNLIFGNKIHIGCIGGHGRTGTVMAALVHHMTGNENAIEYVRKNYCKKAVESQTQIDWLNKHFGINKAKPVKSFHGSGGGYNWGNEPIKQPGTSSKKKFKAQTVSPVYYPGCIWGKHAPIKKKK